MTDLPPCSACRFWRRHTETHGACHRRAPTPLVIVAGWEAAHVALWPTTAAVDGCGDWTPVPLAQKETK